MNVISLGAGVQSSAMLVMADRGLIQADVAIFADTQWEPKYVYDWLEELETLVGIPIVRVTAGDVRKALRTRNNGERFPSMPFHLRNLDGTSGMNRRQCTSDYKLKPVRRWVRAHCKKATMIIGISTDEAHRMKPSQVKYITNEYPLIEMNMSRLDCEKYLMETVGKVPKKSSCIGCPFHGDGFWAELRRESPDEYRQACDYDETIRVNKHMNAEQFLHRSLKPLRNITEFMHETQGRMFYDQFGNECEGMCGL